MCGRRCNKEAQDFFFIAKQVLNSLSLRPPEEGGEDEAGAGEGPSEAGGGLHRSPRPDRRPPGSDRRPQSPAGQEGGGASGCPRQVS